MKNGRQLARALRSESMNWVPPIDSVQHVCELRRRDSNHAIGQRWPDEAALLQPLGVERHAEPVMPKNLNQVTSGASEDVKIAGMRIAPQGLRIPTKSPGHSEMMSPGVPT